MATKKATPKNSEKAKKNVALFKFDYCGRIYAKGEEVDLPEDVIVNLIGRGFVGKEK